MHGAIAWFARNPVAANLLMVAIIATGLLSLGNRIPLEVFPSFELDVVNVQVSYRGASPEEVEEGITIPIEEAVQPIAGIRKITSSAVEGSGTVSIEVRSGYDIDKLLDEVRQKVDALGTLPEDADEPSVTVPSRDREVISVVVAAALPELELRRIADRVRDDIEALPGVSAVSVSGARDYELAIEVPAPVLERYGLSLQSVTNAINRQSLDLAGGVITTASGDIALRSLGQARTAEEFADITVVSANDGTRIRLGDIATIRDGFEENELVQRFNGQNAIEIDVHRTGLESAIAVADAVKDHVADASASMPHGVTLGYWRDSSEVVRQRLATLASSAIQGGFLIILLLTMFLRFRVAMWVFVGVPVSILGGIALMPTLGVTLNLLSLFAFILVLGIVVDDAIVTGENIHSHLRRNPDGLQAAIDGAQEVALPVTFGVLTTVAAFTPLLMIEGARGQLFAQIPLIVIPVLLFSIIESKFVLPAHLRHLDQHAHKPKNAFQRIQQRVADGFEDFVLRVYQPLLATALKYRYITFALFVSSALVVLALAVSGHIRFVFFPRVPSETVRVSLVMPEGTPFDTTRRHIERMAVNAEQLRERYIDPDTGESVIEDIMVIAGSGGRGSTGSHLGRITMQLSPPDSRPDGPTSRDIVREWQGMNGPVAGADSLSYRAEIGRAGSAIDVELAATSFAELRAAAALVKRELARYPGVTEITDSLQGGVEELRLRLRPEADQLGLSLSEIASQVRTAYLGDQVQRLQRDRDEITVVVRYPKAERSTRESIGNLRITTAAGQRVPLSSVVDFEPARALPEIRRVDRRRTLNVEAEVDKLTTDIEAIKRDLEVLAAGELATRHPGVRVSLEGEAREQRESFASLRLGLLIVLLAIYTLLAIPFGSYL
ncbi:MAG: acriflavine resistance protein B, partial [Gammaproteobacteria bacterium]